jgi:GNAT superfamily N-acetyltransferase
MSLFTLRPFTDDDYPAITRIGNALFPEYPETVDEVRHYDTTHPEKCRWARIVAERGPGDVVGYAQYTQDAHMYHPQKFEINILVQADCQGRGLGRTLYAATVDALRPLDPIALRAHAREDYPRSVAFLAQQGFTEAMRDWESRLTMATFDETPFLPALEQVAAQGIRIASYAERADDPERDAKFYALDWAITQDMPSTDTLTEPGFEHFTKNVLTNPNFLPEGIFIASDNGHYVGESQLWRSQASEDLYVGATGIRREYRRRGIATALKIHAARYARTSGVPKIKTWNAQQNRAMLSINEAMGFVKQPAWIQYEKKR